MPGVVEAAPDETPAIGLEMRLFPCRSREKTVKMSKPALT
jgi:hypothetical protein